MNVIPVFIMLYCNLYLFRTVEQLYITLWSMELPIMTCRWPECCLATAQMPTFATRFVTLFWILLQHHYR